MQFVGEKLLQVNMYGFNLNLTSFVKDTFLFWQKEFFKDVALRQVRTSKESA